MHKRTMWRTVGVVLVMVAALAVWRVAAQEPEVIYGLVSVDNAEVRKGPDFAYDALGILPLNASVVVLGRAGDFYSSWDGRQWLEIEYAGGRAWIYARLLRTSRNFNSIFPTGRLLPRDRDGRVPQVFDLSSNVCSQWPSGPFSQSAERLDDATPSMRVSYPTLNGANVYSVIVIAPDGFRTAFDSTTGEAEILLERLPFQEGSYTWRIAPYWTDAPQRFRWQQVCLLRTGGTFTKPWTGWASPTPRPGVTQAPPRPTRIPWHLRPTPTASSTPFLS